MSGERRSGGAGEPRGRCCGSGGGSCAEPPAGTWPARSALSGSRQSSAVATTRSNPNGREGRAERAKFSFETERKKLFSERAPARCAA